MSLPNLRDLLAYHFSLEELRGLCFDLGLEYEDLPGETRPGRAQSLIEYCLRRGRLPELHRRCTALRPLVDWPDLPALAGELDKVQEAETRLQEILTGDQLVAALVPLRQKEMDLLARLLDNPAGVQATLHGGGAVAQGEGATAVGERGVLVGGGVGGHIITGDHVNVYPPGPAGPDDALALQAYLTWLMTERQTLPLRAVGVGKIGAKKRPPEMAQVYVALNTTTFTETAGGERSEEKQKPLSALAALAARRRMVLLGDPGSGKSTFVGHLAYCLAAHTLQPEDNWLAQLPGWPQEQADLLPLLVVLRDFARWLPDPLPAKAYAHHLWDFLAEVLRQEKLENALPPLQEALNEGRALLLLDGLDEVTTLAQRHFVREAVLAFGRRYQDCSLLVTCRLFSYQPPDPEKEEEDLRLPADKYPVLELAPFDDDQRDKFIRAWYGELKRQGHLPGLDEARLSQDLQGAIRRSDLRRVAGNPLLLTVMAMVHVEEGRLPDSRALLYNKTVDLLLLRWEETKGEDEISRLRQLLQEANRTDVDLKARLAEVAFHVHTQAGTATDGERVSDIGEAYLCQELSRLHKKELGWGQKLLEVLKTRAGLLIERSPGQFAFPHRTFQEYLAGVYLASQPDFADQALSWARQDVGWWPLVLFAVEHLVYVNERPLDPLPLISKLCPEAVVETTGGWQQVWLAGEALLSLGQERAGDSEWGQQLLGRVRQRLAVLLDGGHLVPRERAEAGMVLARLGDPRPGVGTILHDGQKLPDIVWSAEIPAGTYTIGDDKIQYSDEKLRQVVIKQPYRLACYPVTYAQFQCFVDAPDFGDERWWAGMPGSAQEMREQAFPFANHPRERVSWYQAMAFGRWLTARLHAGEFPAGVLTGDVRQYRITLPHEYEWEVTARWPNSDVADRRYPWGPEFDAAKANTSEGGIRQTTAVGIYPAGQNAALGLHDLSGNVWEWCRNKYNKRDDEGVDDSGQGRVLRGGSWNDLADLARAAYRDDYTPADRGLNSGFRLVVVRRPPSHNGH